MLGDSPHHQQWERSRSMDVWGQELSAVVLTEKKGWLTKGKTAQMLFEFSVFTWHASEITRENDFLENTKFSGRLDFVNHIKLLLHYIVKKHLSSPITYNINQRKESGDYCRPLRLTHLSSSSAGNTKRISYQQHPASEKSMDSKQMIRILP